mgnify:CR=1 FL=1
MYQAFSLNSIEAKDQIGQMSVSHTVNIYDVTMAENKCSMFVNPCFILSHRINCQKSRDNQQPVDAQTRHKLGNE